LTRPRVCLHLPARMIAQTERVPAFYLRLIEGLADLGAQTEVLHRDANALGTADLAGHFDFVLYSSLRRKHKSTLAPPVWAGSTMWIRQVCFPKASHRSKPSHPVEFRPTVPVNSRKCCVRNWLCPAKAGKRHSRNAVPDGGTGGRYCRPWNHPAVNLDAGDQTSIASSSSMKPEIMFSPLSQNAGSLASRPKGASNSLWCLEPPARSMSKYFA